MIFNLLFLQFAINALLTEALEDPDLVRNCGDAKALALGLTPTKAYLPPQPQVQYYSQPQIRLESAPIQPQIHYHSEQQPQLHIQSQIPIQPELHVKSVAYTTPPVGIAYAPAVAQPAEQSYAVTAGLSTYGSPKYLIGTKSSTPSTISSYSSSSSHSAAAQAASSESSSSSYSSILSAPKLTAGGFALGAGSGGYSHGSSEALGYGSNYGGVSAYKFSAPTAVPIAVKSAAVPLISAKAIPSIQYASAASSAAASAASAYNSQLSSATYSHNVPIGIKYAPTVVPSSVSKYSLASDVSSNYLSSDAYNSKNIFSASVKPAVSVAYSSSPVVSYNSPVAVQKTSVLDNSLLSGLSSSYSSSSGYGNSFLDSSLKTASPVVYSSPTVYRTSGISSLGSSSAGSKYSLASDVSSSYSSLGSGLKATGPAVYDTPVVSTVYSSPSIQHQASSSSSSSLSQKGASSYSYSSGNLGQVHAAPVASIGYAATPIVSKASSSSSSSAGLARGGSSSYSYSSGNLLGGQIHGGPVASVSYAAPSSLVQKSSSVSSNLAHGAASSYAYSSGNLGQVGAIGVKSLVTAPVAVKSAAPAISYASFPSVSTSHISDGASGHGQGLVAAAPTALTYVTSDSNGKGGKDHEKEKHGKYYNAHPKYYFEYYVNDPHTGDIKEQKEERDGDVVNGHYSLVEPDGNIRTVSYQADWETGFHATVTNSKNTVKA